MLGTRIRVLLSLPMLHDSVPRLLQETIDLILLLHFKLQRCLVGVDPFPIEQEAQRITSEIIPTCVRGKYLVHLGGQLDFEEGFFARLVFHPYLINTRS